MTCLRESKPQPSKRLQRRHVDSLWQCDTFQFRIKGIGRAYVTGFTDDCSRHRIVSKAHLNKDADQTVNTLQWALRKGRKPKPVYVDNSKQFIAEDFKKEARKHKIKLTYRNPNNPRGRRKIESRHKTPHRELTSQVTFTPLSHFHKELWKFNQQYNN